jgi:S1-C subfamily serine protease
MSFLARVFLTLIGCCTGTGVWSFHNGPPANSEKDATKEEKSATMPADDKKGDKKPAERLDKNLDKKPDDKLDQKQLFDTIRNGVVAVTVTAHVIIEKYFNNKVWYGTGFIVDLENGLIVTNAHVAGEMAVCTYEVKFGNGQTAAAKLVYLDPCYDFAILSVHKNDIPASCVALECSRNEIEQNQTVHAMGNSMGNEFSVYTGSVFNTRQILSLKPFPEQSFQFTNLTVAGASGSPVFDDRGRVVGVLYGGKLVSGAALPISYVTPVIDSIKRNKKFNRYFIGCLLWYASVQDLANVGSLSPDAASDHKSKFPNSNNMALVVGKKLSAFAAEKSPLEPGDVIWTVSGKRVGAELKLIDAALQEGDGNSVSVEVYRKGSKLRFEVPVSELSIAPKLNLLSFGGAVFCGPIAESKVMFGKLNSGVFIIDSEPGSPFSDVTTKSGGAIYQITRLGDRKISSLDDVEKAVGELQDKERFVVNYIVYPGDGQESCTIVKQVPEFVDASLYTFDYDAKKWNVKPIKKK